MKEIVEPFERLLWFVYRVLFTLIPSVVFLTICAVFISLYQTDFSKSDFYRALSKLVHSLSLEKWIIIFAAIFCINLVLESLTNFLVYRILNFKKLSNDTFAKDTSLGKLLAELNPKFLAYLKAEGNRINLNESLFNFGLLTGNQKSIWFNNYIWFLIAREFLFSNTALVLILSALALFPLTIMKLTGIDFNYYFCLQVSELVLVVCLFVFTAWLLRQNYGSYSRVEMAENKGNVLYKNIFIVLIPLVLATASILIFQSNDTLRVFFIGNCALFFICPVLFLRSFREYLHVEYLIMTFFAKDNYDKKSENNKPHS